ncbi:MAG: hypothetical protein WD875_18045, partial [Pirellulales bacterium]
RENKAPQTGRFFGLVRKPSDLARGQNTGAPLRCIHLAAFIDPSASSLDFQAGLLSLRPAVVTHRTARQRSRRHLVRDSSTRAALVAAEHHEFAVHFVDERDVIDAGGLRSSPE